MPMDIPNLFSTVKVSVILYIPAHPIQFIVKAVKFLGGLFYVAVKFR